MITIVAGTNRRESKAHAISKMVKKMLKELNYDRVNILSLRDIQHDIITDDMYSRQGQSPTVQKIQEELMIPANYWVFVIPEYNGSYPGVMKLFLDALSVREYQATFKNRKIALIGLADGRGGNLRGLDQITNSMHYLGSHIYPVKLPISQLAQNYSEKGLVDPIQKDLRSMLKAFINW